MGRVLRAPDRKGDAGIRLRRFIVLMAFLSALVTVPGCGGCRAKTGEDQEEQEKKAAEERAKKEKEKRKEPFDRGRATTRPSDARNFGGYKPGHAVSVWLSEVKANHADFLGELEIQAETSHGPAPLLATPYELDQYRPLVLPKGQAKSIESFVWMPPAPRKVQLPYSFAQGRGGGRTPQGMVSLAPNPMPSYQYHFVVLARWPGRYDYLDKSLDCIRLRPLRDSEGWLSGQSIVYYRVVRGLPGKRPDLPSHALYWTSIACLLWDDAEPGLLDPEQQQALLDWLHWGGQIILSGPDTLDTLRGSFLEPYLPATAAGTRDLTAADLQPLQRWASNDGTSKSLRPLKPVKPWTGVKLQKHPAARFLPATDEETCELLAERAIGRGRIVVSAFRLSGADLTEWPGWDGLFNSCLLRHPGRSFQETKSGQLQVVWRDHDVYPQPLDARLASRLRLFTRDAGTRFDAYAADVRATEMQAADEESAPLGPGGLRGNWQAEDVSEDDPPPGPGVAAWNDFSPVANAARESLRNAAGIKVPNRSFIVWVLAIYLIVLVPVNWAVFRAAGRVEWAWAAAPLIAIACTAAVIHLAQLNIGFARSQNEIAVVELHGDYPRAHVTRYTALYTSLSTGYRFRAEDPGGLILPFPTVVNPGDFRMLSGESYKRLVCRRGEDTEVSGFAVNSNSIGFVHSEHLADLGGGISLSETADGQPRVMNRTGLALHDVRVIRKGRSGNVQTAGIGALAAGAVAPLEFYDDTASASSAEQPDAGQRPEARPAANAPTGELSLRGLLDIAANPADLRAGQVRLIATAEGEVPGMTIEPAAPQSRQAVLVVAHLDDGPGEAPQRDKNARADLEKTASVPAEEGANVQ